jgi:anaerobic selenocysteine-containing dehydrogenase
MSTTPVRRLLALLALPLLAACGGGYTTQQAVAQCDAERKARPAMSDASRDECVACYEECGVDCVVTGGVPPKFACP